MTRRWAGVPAGRVADFLEHRNEALFLCVIEAKLDGIRASKGRGFADGQLARIVLLKLPRSAHAVIAQSHGDRRSFLPNLKGAVAALDDIGNLRVQPGIRESIDG